MQRLRRVLARILPNVIGLCLLGWFLRGLDMTGFAAAVRALRPGFVVGIAAAAFGESSVQGLLFYCLCPAGQRPWRHVLLSFALNAGNVVLPLRSGELIRPFYLKRWQSQTTYQSLIRWTLADKILQLLAALPLLLLALYFFSADPQLSTALRRLTAGLAGLFLMLGAGLLIWLRGRFSDNLGTQATVLPVRAWLWATFWSLAKWGMAYAVYYFAVPDWKVAVLLTIGVGFGSGIPSLPAGVGAYEAAFLWVGERAHLPHDQVLAAAVVSHAVQLATTLAVGLPVMMLWGWPKAASAEKMASD
jgi:uncharacterized membrane protein YbhN (UPF0104 family)